MDQYQYSWVLLILYALLAGIGVFVVTVAWLGLLGRTTFSDMKGSRAASMTANIAIMFTGMVTMATALTLAFSD